MPEALNYKAIGEAPHYAEFANRTVGNDFDPYLGDPFNVYNISEMFNSWTG